MESASKIKVNFSRTSYILLGLACLLGLLPSSIALISGFALTWFLTNPFPQLSKKGIHYLLKIAVIGLGFGMSFQEVLASSKEGLGLTVFSILSTIILGYFLVKLLGLDRKLGHLISSGTAICGGSAISAIAPIIKADAKCISMSLGVVFALNAIALLIFPSLGRWIGLDQMEFGLWAAIAIHDTSSVVGAAMAYGDEALKVATMVKLSRALWIIPLSFLSIWLFKEKNSKVKIPWFILGFVGAIVLNNILSIPEVITSSVILGSKRLLVISLFFVGTTVSVKDLKAMGVRPLLMAVILWVFISVSSLALIKLF